MTSISDDFVIPLVTIEVNSIVDLNVGRTSEITKTRNHSILVDHLCASVIKAGLLQSFRISTDRSITKLCRSAA